MEEKRGQNKGFILITVIIVSILLFAITVTVTMLSKSHSMDIIKDIDRSKAYYISYAGLEMVYSALNDKEHDIINNQVEYNKEIPGIIKPQELIITDGNKTIGYVEISGDLIENQGSRYFKIESVGRIYEKKEDNSPTEKHILTMYVKQNDPNTVMIYDGVKATLN